MLPCKHSVLLLKPNNLALHAAELRLGGGKFMPAGSEVTNSCFFPLRILGPPAAECTASGRRERRGALPSVQLLSKELQQCKMHDMHLFEVKKPSESKSDWDLYKHLATTPAEEAFRPLSESGCKYAQGQ